MQLSFTDVDPSGGDFDVSLRATTFVVVDLETTGGRARPGAAGGPCDAITEIGAVKVRGGVILGEFATLVDPRRDIPPQIVRLTGITTAMVHDAPAIDAVLPMFLEFCRGAVLVAHNAGFDIGFLKSAAAQCDIAWPNPPVLCTVRLARRVLSREEAPSVRLAAMARLFRAACEPTHRALDDARATVDVLHGLIERVGNLGVHTYTDLRSYLPNVTPAQRRKRVLAGHLPHRPGVYLFRGPGQRGPLRGDRGEPASPGRPVLHRGRPARPDARDGGAGRIRRPRRVRARPGGRGARTTAAGRPRAALQPPVEVSAPLVVGDAHRRGVPAAVGGARTAARQGRGSVPRPRRRRRDGRSAGPVHRSAHLHHPAGADGAARAVLPPA